MAINPEHVSLVRRFEPILYFGPGESFFPSDAKRYLEHCALWRAQAPFDNKNSWGGTGTPFPRSPLVAHGKIAGLESEVRPGDTFLGDAVLTPLPGDEQFLDLAGWFGPITPSGGSLAALMDARAVDNVSENRFASLTGILGVEGLYDAYHDVIPGSTLKESRFWYHAEAFDQERIRDVMSRGRGLDFATFTKKFNDPFLICYYLFFPGHLAPLEGCEGTFIGPRFGSFAGEWACIALLLDRPSAQQPFQPRFIGLTSRNIGQIQFLDEERRVGMKVLEWGLVTKVNDHPRLFVARNTHGLYAIPGAKPLKPFTPNDPGLENCGTVESLDEAIPDKPDSSSKIVIFVAKFLATIWSAGIVGTMWMLNESEPFGTAPVPGQQFDHPPEEGVYGRVVKPRGVVLPDAGQAQEEIAWSVPPPDPMNIGNHSMNVGGRTCSFMVDRRETDPQKRQVWWPSDGTHAGYDGRWGPRVANDPRGRRAGMRFPDFAQMFLRGLQQELSK